MRGDTTIRGAAALVLLSFLVLIVALYDPFAVPVDFETALPLVLVCGAVVLVLLHENGRF